MEGKGLSSIKVVSLNYYKYKNNFYYPYYCFYNNFEIKYELYRKKAQWHAEVDACFVVNNKNKILFKGKNKNQAHEKLLSWFKHLVNTGKIVKFINNDSSIAPAFENILMRAAHNMSIGYHVSPTKLRGGILNSGLVPNGTPDKELITASKTIDKYKPASIPAWVARKKAIYLHPEIDNFFLADKTINSGCDLYVANINPEKCWIGSYGIGGACLATPLLYKKHPLSVEDNKEIEHYAKLYWKYSCSLVEYLTQNKRVVAKNKKYGLDEILVFHPLKSEDIKLIGYWTDKGQFKQTNHFNKYVKKTFANNYLKILSLYQNTS